MKGKRSLVSVFVAGVVVAAIAVLSTTRGQAVTIAPTTGHLAPAFQLVSLTGQQVSLSQLQGKLVFVNFFASWCPPCQRETPDLVNMYKQYGNRVQFVGIDLTSNDSQAAVAKFVRQYGIAYPVLLDTTGQVAASYQVLGIPTSLFISRSGIVVARAEGGMTEATMRSDFAKLLKDSAS